MIGQGQVIKGWDEGFATMKVRSRNETGAWGPLGYI